MDDRSPGSNPGGLEDICTPATGSQKKPVTANIFGKRYQPEETRNLIDLSQDCVD
jgi:hypothetical protein